MTTKSLKIHTVEITTRSGTVLKFYVRHYTSASARAFVLENHVTANVSSQQDIIDMVRDDIEPIGLIAPPSATLPLPLEVPSE